MKALWLGMMIAILSAEASVQVLAQSTPKEGRECLSYFCLGMSKSEIDSVQKQLDGIRGWRDLAIRYYQGEKFEYSLDVRTPYKIVYNDDSVVTSIILYGEDYRLMYYKYQSKAIERAKEWISVMAEELSEKYGKAQPIIRIDKVGQSLLWQKLDQQPGILDLMKWKAGDIQVTLGILVWDTGKIYAYSDLTDIPGGTTDWAFCGVIKLERIAQRSKPRR